MIVNKKELIIPFDVDSTLIHDIEHISHHPRGITFDYYGMPRYAVPNLKHIELLKAYKQRGAYIRVHSGNGHTWAEEVIKKLKLEEYVDEIETKAMKYVDDIPFDQFTQRIYLGEPDDIK